MQTRPTPPAQNPCAPMPQRNRDRLARGGQATAFAAQGVDASLEEIARQAGVGIGTLYRHFPTREHLVEVVYRREVEALCHAADELASHHPPDVALEQWMQRFVDDIGTKRGLATSLRILFTTNSTLFSDVLGPGDVGLAKAGRRGGGRRLDPQRRLLLGCAACAVGHLFGARHQGLARPLAPAGVRS